MTTMSPGDDAAREVRLADWPIRDDTIYLNHGSFGITPRPVREARQAWQQRLDEQPMDFFCRQLDTVCGAAREQLAQFVGEAAKQLVFVDNATFAMNVVADSFPLQPGDEVLLTDHEYGAVKRIWERACRRAGTSPPRVARLPLPMEDRQQVVDSVLEAVTDQTRLLVISHVTSPTAVILPVGEICRAARQRDLAVCVDGPHALAQLPLHIDALGCDFYTASCHKWLSAPLGSGFLYVAPHQCSRVQSPILSWGRLPVEGAGCDWSHEFAWWGTRSPAALLAVPAAIDYLRRFGLEPFRRDTHALARSARQQIECLTGLPALVPDSPAWYGSMTQLPLPACDRQRLQSALWQEYGIEVPIVDWNDRQFIRVSCHLYNSPPQIERLLRALDELLFRTAK